MNSYIEEFQRLCMKSKTKEEKSEKVSRHLNGLRYNIQEELNLLSSDTIGRCHQLAIKVEEKIKRRQEQNNKGRGR